MRALPPFVSVPALALFSVATIAQVTTGARSTGPVSPTNPSVVLSYELSAQASGPRLWTADGAPVIDSAFSFGLEDAVPGQVGMVYMSLDPGDSVLPFGLLWLDPGSLLEPMGFVVGTDGTVTLPVFAAVPSSLCGVEVFAQAVVVDLPSGTPALSNALGLRMGTSPGFRFADPVAFGVGESPRGMAVGDFDEDGRPDFAVANTATGDVSVYLADSTDERGYRHSATVVVGTCPGGVAVADLNLDGHLDFVTPNSGSDDISSVLGNGDGTFGGAIPGPTTAGPRGLVVGDFDLDLVPDVALCNFSNDTVTVLLGRSDGTFLVKEVIPIVDGPFHMVCADMNGDFVSDLVLAARSSADVQVLLADGAGSFHAPQAYAVGRSPRRVAVGDVNGDGVLDVAAANFSDRTITIVPGLGNGVFGEHEQLISLPDRPYYLDIADLDGDGHADLAIGTSNLKEALIAKGSGDYNFQLLPGIPFPSDPNSVLARDMDRDGIADLLMSIGPSGPGGCPAPTGVTGEVVVRTNLLGEL